MIARATAATLPRWANDILAAAPARGAGLNRWLIRAAVALRRCGRETREITQTLEAATAGEPVRRGEIERAVERSIGYMTDRPGAPTARTACLTLDRALRSAIIAQGGGVVAADLWEVSPYRLIDDGPDAEGIIDLLFPDNPLLCCATKLEQAITQPREQWRGRLANMQFIVPNPMRGVKGLTRAGRSSARCLDNVGARRFLVVEQDAGTPDEQASILLHLAQHAPLAVVVHSGGKSLHGWFRCGGATESQQRQFFSYAVSLGADPATRTLCQLVRLPEGRRGNGARQAVLFLNPEVLP